MVWGWFSASALIFLVGLAISKADLGSSLPTSGCLYWWTHYLAANRYKDPLNGFASFVVSLGTISSDVDGAPSRGYLYTIFVATVLCHGILATSAGRIMHHLQTWFVLANFGLILATLIASPVSMRTAWPSGWTFMLSWFSLIWTIGAFDSYVHMSEEAKNPTKDVPIGILASIGGCWVFGFLVTAVLAACAATIYYNALGKSGALGFMSAISILQFFMGLSIRTSLRLWQRLDKRGALPFSTLFRKNQQTISIPATENRMGNLHYGYHPAGNNVARGIPIICRVVWGRGKFCPGPFYTGRFSVATAIAALLYLTFSTILCMFPTEGPDPDLMNHSAVVNGTVWGGALLYYFLYAHKWFTGPKHTLDPARSEDDTTQHDTRAAYLSTPDLFTITS
ncbi:GABA-specific permease [Trichoderma ghanense]|uniref:GABA-specific permease n=1 Tax=Trichoderma ghanense TaxID=65468 RepID=A0ABY2GXF2_9HYPO